MRRVLTAQTEKEKENKSERVHTLLVTKQGKVVELLGDVWVMGT